MATIWTRGLEGWIFERIEGERLDERLRIASDLHDDVQQRLTEILMIARCLESDARRGRPQGSGLARLVRASEDSIESLRRAVYDLQASPLGRGGLLPMLHTLVRDLQLDWRLPIALQVGPLPKLPPERQVALYQVAREGLVNALRHGSPRMVSLRLEASPRGVRLSVEDDGVGFDPREVDPRTHFGLALIRRRVRRAGGVLEVVSGPGEGTRLSALFPLPKTVWRGLMKIGPLGRLGKEIPWPKRRSPSSSSRSPQRRGATSSSSIRRSSSASPR